MNYLIGDVQGCCDALDRLLDKIGFFPRRATACTCWATWSIEARNRWPRCAGCGAWATRPGACWATTTCTCWRSAHGGRSARRNDTLAEVLDAPDRDEWVEWLRHRPMAMFEQGWLMVHAGVLPQWDLATTLTLAAEVQAMLRSPELGEFLKVMYSDEPLRWSDELRGAQRLRLIINVLTRIRFCQADGTLDLATKEAAGSAPDGHYPWFDVPGRLTRGVPTAFGHWSTLGLINRPGLLALDTGCVWGGQLTAVRVDGGRREVIQVACEQAQAPG